MANFPQPPDPVLKRIYPWDNYDITLVMKWLYTQAQKTGFHGSFEDFKMRYGSYIEAAEPTEIYDLIENYTGIYHVTPLEGIEQVLQTKNKVLNQNIIIDASKTYDKYNGSYKVTPLANLEQILRTKNKIAEDNIIIEQIPYAEVSNTAGGVTCIIG